MTARVPPSEFILPLGKGKTLYEAGFYEGTKSLQNPELRQRILHKLWEFRDKETEFLKQF